MEDGGKYKNLNSSSLIGLKSELLRKQQEFKQSKLSSFSVNKPVSSLHLKTDKKNEKSKPMKLPQTSTKDKNDSAEPDDLRKSRYMLEQKAKLYDKLTSGAITTEDDRFLVNFKQKSSGHDFLRGTTTTVIRDESAQPKIEDDVGEEEEWVDYIDASGKPQKCLKMDLPYFMSKTGSSKEEPLNSRTTEEQIPGKEGPIHFEDVKFNERRSLGVGYFQFSKDEAEREKQMDLLHNLRGKTMQEQTANKKRMDKRKTGLESRLAKVKERKLLQMGLPIDSLDKLEEVKAKDQVSNEQVEKPETVVTEYSTEPKPYTVRPWDKGKVDLQELLLKKKKDHIMSQDEWVAKKRTERPSEFAPCYDNFVKPKKHKTGSTSNTSTATAATAASSSVASPIKVIPCQPKSASEIEKTIAESLAYFRSQLD